MKQKIISSHQHPHPHPHSHSHQNDKKEHRLFSFNNSGENNSSDNINHSLPISMLSLALKTSESNTSKHSPSNRNSPTGSISTDNSVSDERPENSFSDFKTLDYKKVKSRTITPIGDTINIDPVNNNNPNNSNHPSKITKTKLSPQSTILAAFSCNNTNLSTSTPINIQAVEHTQTIPMTEMKQ